MQFNEERKAFLIKQLALKEPLVKVRDLFNRIFEERLTGEELMSFESTFKAAIEKQSMKELNDIKKEPLAHSRIRLRALNDALTYAMTPRATKSVPVRSEGKQIEYEVVYEPDYSAITNIIKAAQNEEFFIKKMFLEVLKNKLTENDLGANGESGFSIFEVDNGLKKIESDGI
jgi:hypothetical protein